MTPGTALAPEVEAAVPVHDNGEFFEIIDGRRVELPPMSWFSSITASRLHGEMHGFARSHSLGQACMETLFHLPLPVDRNRRPDVAFVSSQRWAAILSQPRRNNALDALPNLAVEVTS